MHHPTTPAGIVKRVKKVLPAKLEADATFLPIAQEVSHARKSIHRRGQTFLALVCIALLTVLTACMSDQGQQSKQPQLEPQQLTATATVRQRYATEAARATSIYVATNYPFSTDLVLNDPLSANQNNTNGVKRWEENDTCAFRAGKYHLTASTGKQGLCTAQGEDFKIVTYEVTVSNIKGDAGVGITFRYNDMGQYMAFVVYPDGSYRPFVRTTENIPLPEGKLTSPLPSTFRLGVTDDGVTLRFYIDGKQVGVPVAVGQYNELGLESGSIGTLVYSEGDNGEASFSNAKVWKLAEGGR